MPEDSQGRRPQVGLAAQPEMLCWVRCLESGLGNSMLSCLHTNHKPLSVSRSMLAAAFCDLLRQMRSSTYLCWRHYHMPALHHLLKMAREQCASRMMFVCSGWASSISIYNKLVETRPDLVQVPCRIACPNASQNASRACALVHVHCVELRRNAWQRHPGKLGILLTGRRLHVHFMGQVPCACDHNLRSRTQCLLCLCRS